MGLQAGNEKLGKTRLGPEEQPGEQRPCVGKSANQREQMHVIKAKTSLLSWWPLQSPFFRLTSYSNLFIKRKAWLGYPSPEANKPEKKKARNLG